MYKINKLLKELENLYKKEPRKEKRF